MKNSILASDFSQGSVIKHILGQAVPLTIAQLIQLLYNVIDRVYLGHLPGTGGAALTGVGLVFPIIAIVSAFTSLFSMGGAPLFSMARGAGKNSRAMRVMNNTFSLLAGTAVILMIVGYVFKRPILMLFGASDVTYPYADGYLTIYLLGTVFVMLATGMNPFVNALGHPRIGMMIVASGAVLNLVLDPLFLFALHMGVQGAATATVISQLVSAVLVLLYFHRENVYVLKKEYMKPEWPLVRRITGLGLSGFFMGATNSLVQIVCNRTLSIYGGDIYVGIMTVLNSVREIANVAIAGITNGSQPIISYNYGAGCYARVRRAIAVTFCLGAGYTTLFWAAIMLFPGVFIHMFSGDASLYEPGITALKQYFFGFFFMSFQFAGQSTFVALGKSHQAIFFSLLRKVIIVVPLTVFLPKIAGLGVHGVFLAEPVSNAIGGTACFVTMLVLVGRELRRGEKAARKSAKQNSKTDGGKINNE